MKNNTRCINREPDQQFRKDVGMKIVAGCIKPVLEIVVHVLIFHNNYRLQRCPFRISTRKILSYKKILMGREYINTLRLTKRMY